MQIMLDKNESNIMRVVDKVFKKPYLSPRTSSKMNKGKK